VTIKTGKHEKPIEMDLLKDIQKTTNLAWPQTPLFVLVSASWASLLEYSHYISERKSLVTK
jgi:hypothetical protein